MREQAYAGLFALLDPLVTAGTLKETSRRLEFAEDVAPERTPGVWQLQLDEQPFVYSFGGIGGWDLLVDWYIYVTQSDETAPSTPIINPVLDAVVGVLPLANDNDDPNGNVYVNGVRLTITLRDKIHFWEGLLNQKAVVQIPLRIRVPFPGS